MSRGTRTTGQGIIDSLGPQIEQRQFAPQFDYGLGGMDPRAGTFQNISMAPEWFQDFTQQHQGPGRWTDIYNQYAPQLMGQYSQYGDAIHNPFFMEQGMDNFRTFNPFDTSQMTQSFQRLHKKGEWEGSALYGERAPDQYRTVTRTYNPWTGEGFVDPVNQQPSSGRQGLPPPDFLGDG